MERATDRQLQEEGQTAWHHPEQRLGKLLSYLLGSRRFPLLRPTVRQAVQFRRLARLDRSPCILELTGSLQRRRWNLKNRQRKHEKQA